MESSRRDTPTLWRFGVPFIEPDPATFYGIGPKGYTDYPVLADAVAA
jgi:hypothetical protein